MENQFVHSQNLNRTIVKVALLKLSVGMIVVQGAAVQFIYEFGGFSDIDDDSQFSAAEKAQRGYGKLDNELLMAY